MVLSNLPRVRLAHLPTPLQELPNLSKALNGPKIFVKRDDMTGLALGGNKTRKLEYLMADAISKQAGIIVTGAGFHSNWCTQAAAAARRLGMKIVLIKKGPVEDYDPEAYDGNHLLHFLMGADIKVVRPEDESRVYEQTMERLKENGRRPYLLKDTGSTPPGAAGYMNAILEILQQSVELGVDFNYLIHTTGSGGTQAGLVIGAKAFSTRMKIIGSTTGSRTKEEATEKVNGIIEAALKLVNLNLKIEAEDIHIYDQYAGGGYGNISVKKAEAIKLAAETEGIILDPVYTASSMACLIDLCRQGFFKSDDSVVFLHTGGAAALSSYGLPLKAYGHGEKMPWSVPPWSPQAG